MGEEINLDDLAYDIAKFARSDREPTSASSLIRGPRPFYYQWTRKGGIEILTFDNPTDPQTAKLFKFSKKQLSSGVDLRSDEPALIGDEVVKVLNEYIAKCK